MQGSHTDNHPELHVYNRAKGARVTCMLMPSNLKDDNDTVHV